MKILPQMLTQFHEFSKEYIETFRNRYPDGQELATLLQDTTIDDGIIWLLKKYFEFNKEEMRWFCKRMNIDDQSTIYYNSSDLTNSHFIFNSKNIDDCSYINHCNDIYGSAYIVGSENIKHSVNVYGARDVCESTFVVNSEKVEQSNYISKSRHIEWSNYITNSVDVLESQYSYNSEDIQNCSFCGFVKKSKNCSFCFGVERKEYLIFNKEVTPIVYAKWNDELNERLATEISTMITIRDNYDLSSMRLVVTSAITPIYNGLSSDFISWIIGTKFFDLEVFERLNITD